MDPDSRTSLIVIVLMFLISMFAALSETAISSVSKTRMKVIASRGDRRAERVLGILERFPDAVTTLLIVTNIAHIAAASSAAALSNRLFGLSSVTITTFVMTILMFFIGEMLPKSIGKKACEPVSLAVASILRALMFVFFPLSKLLSAIGTLFGKIFRGEEESSVTEDEIYDIIDDMAEEGAIDEEQSELISSALSFSDVTASSILTPRVDVEAIEIDTDEEEVLRFLKSQNHSRILVYDKTIDQVEGVLQIRKFLKEYLRTGTVPHLRDMLDEVYYAYQGTDIQELLAEMSKRKLNMAVITDNYGGTLGIVTVEDILEEIVGEIWDEDDEIEEPIVKLSDDTYRVDGTETVLDVFETVGYEEKDSEEEDRFTNLIIAEWVYESLDKIPESGDGFTYGNLRITVENIEKNRILSVIVTVFPEEKEAEE